MGVRAVAAQAWNADLTVHSATCEPSSPGVPSTKVEWRMECSGMLVKIEKG